MTTGSCFCGNIQVEFSGEPMIVAICHCHDCRKITGTLYSYNFVFKSDSFKISGRPKELPKTCDSGGRIMNHFCGDCGTPLYGHKVNADGSAGELKIVRAGIFDDETVNKYKPGHEVYTGRRTLNGSTYLLFSSTASWSGLKVTSQLYWASGRKVEPGSGYWVSKPMSLEAHVTQGPWWTDRG
ncbi:uncharacterized protein An11g01330 [Aspergillus niger]|uniref:Contig An11c0050, genomic contig n=2 Tax=Aspergillus niger TaxID=5061 RepID=A2QVG6_ASPNC|nr:uncharacterized protein An11g01330 [Aspergillus niger]CAK45870.1 unnamed protein product [Aspergillus niger]